MLRHAGFVKVESETEPLHQRWTSAGDHDMTITATDSAESGADRIERTGGLSKYIGFVASEGSRFASAAEMGALDVAIAACPGWNMRDLVRHLGEIHLWAATNVAFPKPTWLKVGGLTDLAPYWPDLAAAWPSDTQLVSWYRATLANLLHVLESAPIDVEAFTFLPAPSPLLMWARRQASEIAIHRFDAEAARNLTSRFDPQFASDMLDELVSGFAPRSESVAVDAERVLHVSACDVGEQWWVTFGPGGITTSRGGGDADLTVSATAAELYLSLWNRAPDSTVQLAGDPDVMTLWHDTCRVRWFR